MKISKLNLRTKILSFSIIISLTLGIEGLYNQLSMKDFVDRMTDIVSRNNLMYETEDDVLTINDAMHEYLNLSGSALKTLLKAIDNLRNKLTQFDIRPVMDESKSLKIDIYFLIQEYLNICDKVILSKRARNIENLSIDYAQSQKIIGFIHNSLINLRVVDFNESKTRIIFLSEHLSIMQILNGIMYIVLLITSIIFGFWFSITISKPLEELTRSTVFIAAGEYENAKIKIRSDDEFGSLGQTFEKMRLAIISNLEELKEKSLIEKGLMEERVNNLNMKHLLKQSELKALQSRINPHFLFNTLNAGIQIAIIEDADQTRIFMENLSDLLRKTLHTQDKPISIQEEISGLDSYLYLIKLRFTDRYTCKLNISNNIPSLFLPSLILQPLVENSLMHGLGDTENGGTIEIFFYEEEKYFVLGVADNGVGISPQKIKELLSPSEKMDYSHGGIGLSNVIQRMSLYFENKDITHIESEIGKGTKIWFEIPKSKGKFYDKNYSS